MAVRGSRWLFFDRSVGRRLFFMVLVTAVGLVSVLAITAAETREALLAAKATETRHLVETAAALVADYQHRAAQGELTEAVTQRAVLTSLSRLRYERDQYF